MRQRRLRSSPHGWIAVATFVLMVAALLFAALAPASATRPLTVSLTFDDGRANQMTAQQLLVNHGMVGTFYINSSNIDTPGGHMTRGDLETLRANGHEIGGHSANHLSLRSLSLDEVERQICTDRNTLLSWGYAVTSFAYPFSDFNQSVQSTVRACGYNTARTVGNLWSPHDCAECAATEPIPPSDLYATGTAADVNETWTLEDLQSTVTRAETNGGWLTFVFHSVCDGCDPYSIRQSVLDQFLTWLQTRSETSVKTVQQVVTGSVQPTVAPPPPAPPGGPGVNTVRNPSLEAVSAVDTRLPQCFDSAGYGNNSVTFARIADAHSGRFAERVTVGSIVDGDATLLPIMDLGECSSQVASGRIYEVSVWYKSDVAVAFQLYKRNAIGQWTYWEHSSRFAPTPVWTRAAFVSPPTPADALGVSFGLAINSAGALTTDDYGFAEVPR